jgi:alanine-synthesizing transaminase
MEFFERLVHFAKKEDILVVHDLAYSEICFDGYVAPSFLQVKGAKSVGIEFYSMSKTYSMAGWRVGFAVGNRRIIEALARIKGYYDYGIFTPVQVASIVALDSSQDCVNRTADMYKRRRDVLVTGLNRIGWKVPLPRATMYLWASIPDKFRRMKSLKFAEFLLEKAEVAVSPGIGFGAGGEGYVRFALVENEHRLRQAIRGIKRAFQ